MSRSKCKRVFILGAGCSARYGYPLGLNLVEELRRFLGRRISDGGPTILNAVSKLVALAARFSQADTLDKLVNLFEERFKAFRGDEGGVGWTNADTKRETLTDEQILNAKIATAALFLDKEEEARSKTLKGYKEYLLPSIFGQDQDWQCSVNNSDCCVFTFNYDRLFEIAFLDYFPGFDPQRCPLYGNWVLNSGFDPTLAFGLKRLDIKPDRFCFLKLHGSAGWWARKCASPSNEKWRDYCPASPDTPTDLPQLENWLAQDNGIYRWEPLIAFPHEKQRFASDDAGDFVQGPYIDEVWRHAAAVLQVAAEVTVIGYSFASIDRTHSVENLLSRTPKTTRIRIENKDVEAIKQTLKDFEVLQGRLDFDQRTF